MDSKTLETLEYPKILERLAGYCAFPVSAEKARQLLPSSDILEAISRQRATSEAVQLLTTHPQLTIGGARDIRESLSLAERGGVLSPGELLDVKYTLIAARNLGRLFERKESQYPQLSDLASRLPPAAGLIDTISRAISERGELLDSASAELKRIRHDVRVVHDRLLGKLQRMVSDPKFTPYLQEALVTQRDGRYVLPLRAEFKGRIKALVHDQSSSGATLFVEPLGVVELNNTYRELQLAERDEERRILTELSAQVGQQGIDIELSLDIMADIDLALARARYSDELEAIEPELVQLHPKKGRVHPGCELRLYQARHPLLDPEGVVPIDIELDPQTYALIITGPNTGGKTVTLKTVGLLAVMAQAGLHIPAGSGSEMSVFRDIFADIGDEQSIEQSLSTFSGHITNITRILAHADQRSLVILDELGAGTDPQEGAALARALMTHLLGRGITTFVTTHHPELKAYAHATAGVVNASMEFDLETLQPTYRLSIGLPGRSNALAIAERLGMPDEIVADARSELSPSDLQVDDLLDEIHRQRELARTARAAAEKARQVVEQQQAELVERLEKIEDERQTVLAEARADAEGKVAQLQKELRQVRRALARAGQPLEALKQAEEQLAALEKQVEQPIERQVVSDLPELLKRPVRLGDKVRLRALNTEGVVTALSESEAEVQVGVLRIRTRLSEVQPLKGGFSEDEQAAEEGQSQPAQPIQSGGDFYHASPGMEIDLRGKRGDEALDALEHYLDAAYLSGLPFARIIHGKGTGRLRSLVREALSTHPHVRSFEGGKDNEGGEGVTVAKLRST
jgi:DNA mismatch repair protein MutS2